MKWIKLKADKLGTKLIFFFFKTTVNALQNIGTLDVQTYL